MKIVILFTGLLKSWYHLTLVPRFDIIFIHREITPIGPPIFEWIIARVFRKRIIYDFDDAIWLNDGHDSHLQWKLKARWKVAKICQWSWKVSAGNQYLADFATQHCNDTFVFPTVVDTEYFSPIESPKTKLIVGWTGSHSTLIYLEKVIPVIKELSEHFDFEFLVIANHPPTFELANLRYVKWSEEREIQDLSMIDIGIMPLPDDEWTKGKCGFKLIQYGAIGIPSVASPVGVNQNIIKEGVNGYFASTEEEWKDKLSVLLNDGALRKKMGEAARKEIVASYSRQSNSEKWNNLFQL